MEDIQCKSSRKRERNHTRAITVDGGILCVQRSVRDAGLGLDGLAGVSAHDSIRMGASTIAEAEDLVDLKI
jgi:hypothetical protein